MKKFNWLMSGLLLVALSVSAAVAAPKNGKKKKVAAGDKRARKVRPDKMPAGMTEMIKVVGLDAAQQAEMKAKMKAHVDAKKAWAADPARGGKVRALRESLKAAGNDKAKAAPIKKELAELIKESRGGAVNVESVLRPDQKAKWAGYKLQKQMAGKLRKAGLSPDQNVRIAAMCDAAAARLAAIEADDKKSRGKVIKSLQVGIQGVLTPEQKAKLAPVKKPKGPKAPQTTKKPRKQGTKKQSK